MDGSGKRVILLVDDDGDAIAGMKGMLRSLGFSVVAETDWKQALEAFRKKSEIFDVAILDYLMEGMSGFSLAAKLYSIRPDVPVILLSGYVNRAVEAESKNMGFKACLSKPLTRAEIKQAIERVL
jgi:CheY-like chemotaxis protein